MNPIVKKYLQKKIFDQKGFIASAKSVQFSYDGLAARMKNLGLDINLIKSEKDLNQALGFIKSIEDQVFKERFGNMLSKKESAEIFDLDKNKLNPDESIMGGTQDEKEMLTKSIDRNVKEATEKGDFTGIRNQLLRDKDILREFELSKKFPFRRDTNVRSGEDAIPLARAAKFDDEMGIKSLPDRDYSVDKLVKDFKKFGKATDDDIKLILGSGKSGQIPYVMDQYGMSYKDVISTLKSGKPLIEGLAQGGRAGLRLGSKGPGEVLEDEKKLKQKIESFLIKRAPFGILMDSPKNQSLNLENLNRADRPSKPEITIGPYKPESDIDPFSKENLVEFDDGTFMYKDSGKYFKVDEEDEPYEVPGPSEGAKPIPKTMEAAQGGRAGFDNGSKPKGLLDLLDIKASGSKSGKQDIQGAPKGFTEDAEQYNFIANLEIPVTEKVKLLANLIQGKSRNRIEKDNNELFMMDDGYKNRNIGLSFNEGGEGLSAKLMKNIDTGEDDFRIQLLKRFATGGRVGFKVGSESKRAFLKAAGGLAALIASIKSGLIGMPKKEVAKQVVKESVKDVANAPPSYFFNLVNKIKKFGRDDIPLQERQKVTQYKNYEMVEDLTNGDVRITKSKGSSEAPNYKEEVMEYSPGGQVEEGGYTTPKRYEEGTLSVDESGKMKNAEIGLEQESIEEIMKDATEVVVKQKIKRASGGVAHMLGE